MNEFLLQKRIEMLEEALLLMLALLTGQPEDATDEEKLIAQNRLGNLLESMKERMCT